MHRKSESLQSLSPKHAQSSLQPGNNKKMTIPKLPPRKNSQPALLSPRNRSVIQPIHFDPRLSLAAPKTQVLIEKEDFKETYNVRRTRNRWGSLRATKPILEPLENSKISQIRQSLIRIDPYVTQIDPRKEIHELFKTKNSNTIKQLQQNLFRGYDDPDKTQFILNLKRHQSKMDQNRFRTAIRPESLLYTLKNVIVNNNLDPEVGKISMQIKRFGTTVKRQPVRFKNFSHDKKIELSIEKSTPVNNMRRFLPAKDKYQMEVTTGNQKGPVFSSQDISLIGKDALKFSTPCIFPGRDQLPMKLRSQKYSVPKLPKINEDGSNLAQCKAELSDAQNFSLMTSQSKVIESPLFRPTKPRLQFKNTNQMEASEIQNFKAMNQRNEESAVLQQDLKINILKAESYLSSSKFSPELTDTQNKLKQVFTNEFSFPKQNLQKSQMETNETALPIKRFLNVAFTKVESTNVIFNTLRKEEFAIIQTDNFEKKKENEDSLPLLNLPIANEHFGSTFSLRIDKEFARTLMGTEHGLTLKKNEDSSRLNYSDVSALSDNLIRPSSKSLKTEKKDSQKRFIDTTNLANETERNFQVSAKYQNRKSDLASRRQSSSFAQITEEDIYGKEEIKHEEPAETRIDNENYVAKDSDNINVNNQQNFESINQVGETFKIDRNASVESDSKSQVQEIKDEIEFENNQIDSVEMSVSQSDSPEQKINDQMSELNMAESTSEMKAQLFKQPINSGLQQRKTIEMQLQGEEPHEDYFTEIFADRIQISQKDMKFKIEPRKIVGKNPENQIEIVLREKDSFLDEMENSLQISLANLYERNEYAEIKAEFEEDGKNQIEEPSQPIDSAKTHVKTKKIQETNKFFENFVSDSKNQKLDDLIDEESKKIIPENLTKKIFENLSEESKSHCLMVGEDFQKQITQIKSSKLPSGQFVESQSQIITKPSENQLISLEKNCTTFNNYTLKLLSEIPNQEIPQISINTDNIQSSISKISFSLIPEFQNHSLEQKITDSIPLNLPKITQNLNESQKQKEMAKNLLARDSFRGDGNDSNPTELSNFEQTKNWSLSNHDVQLSDHKKSVFELSIPDRPVFSNSSSHPERQTQDEPDTPGFGVNHFKDKNRKNKFEKELETIWEDKPQIKSNRFEFNENIKIPFDSKNNNLELKNQQIKESQNLKPISSNNFAGCPSSCFLPIQFENQVAIFHLDSIWQNQQSEDQSFPISLPKSIKCELLPFEKNLSKKTIMSSKTFSIDKMQIETLVQKIEVADLEMKRDTLNLPLNIQKLVTQSSQVTQLLKLKINPKDFDKGNKRTHLRSDLQQETKMNSSNTHFDQIRSLNSNNLSLNKPDDLEIALSNFERNLFKNFQTKELSNKSLKLKFDKQRPLPLGNPLQSNRNKKESVVLKRTKSRFDTLIIPESNDKSDKFRKNISDASFKEFKFDKKTNKLKRKVSFGKKVEGSFDSEQENSFESNGSRGYLPQDLGSDTKISDFSDDDKSTKRIGGIQAREFPKISRLTHKIIQKAIFENEMSSRLIPRVSTISQMPSNERDKSNLNGPSNINGEVRPYKISIKDNSKPEVKANEILITESELKLKKLNRNDSKIADKRLFTTGGICCFIFFCSFLTSILLFKLLDDKIVYLNSLVVNPPTIKTFYEDYKSFFLSYQNSQELMKGIQNLRQTSDNFKKYREYTGKIAALNKIKEEINVEALHMKKILSSYQELYIKNGNNKSSNLRVLGESKKRMTPLKEFPIRMMQKLETARFHLSRLKEFQKDKSNYFQVLLNNFNQMSKESENLLKNFGKFYVLAHRLWATTNNIFEVNRNQHMKLMNEYKEQLFENYDDKLVNVNLSVHEFYKWGRIDKFDKITLKVDRPTVLVCQIQAKYESNRLNEFPPSFDLTIVTNDGIIRENTGFDIEITGIKQVFNIKKIVMLETGLNNIGLYAQVKKGDIQFVYVETHCNKIMQIKEFIEF